jgi:hypothetical protein
VEACRVFFIIQYTMFLIYDVTSDPLVDCSLGCTIDDNCQSQPVAHILKFLRVQVSNSQTNEGSEVQKIHIFHHDLLRTRSLGAHVTHSSTALYKDYQRTSSTLLSDQWPHVRVAYISSSISSKISTFTAPDRLRLVRRSLMRELGLWR